MSLILNKKKIQREVKIKLEKYDKFCYLLFVCFIGALSSCTSQKSFKANFPTNIEYVEDIFNCGGNMKSLQENLSSQNVEVIKFRILDEPPGIIIGVLFQTKDSIPFVITFKKSLTAGDTPISKFTLFSEEFRDAKIKMVRMQYGDFVFKKNIRTCRGSAKSYIIGENW